MYRQLFSISTNAKTVKGEALGYLTGVMYLAPSQELMLMGLYYSNQGTPDNRASRDYSEGSDSI